jgi:hypothetical protein
MNTALFDGLVNQVTTTGGGFHAPRPPGVHQGRDSRAGVGTPVYAAGHGVVTGVNLHSAVYGFELRIAYPVAGGMITVLSGHLSRILVAHGDQVSPGSWIGLSGGEPGSPGAGVSRSPHLHEGVIIDGRTVDPDLHLNARSLIPAGGDGTPIEGETGMRFFTDETGKKSVSTEVGTIGVANATADACFRVEFSTGTVASADLAVYNSVKAAINLDSNKGISVVTDSTKILEALTALDTQADIYQTALLAQIANVDEATLLTLGLKRI